MRRYEVSTDGTPGENGKTPVFKTENNILYWKYSDDGDDKWQSLGNVKGDKGDQGDPGTPALSGVDDNGTYYTITYSDGKTVNAQKWVDASNVSVQFSTNLISWETTTVEFTGENETIYYRMTGAASYVARPSITATTEGGYYIDNYDQPSATLGYGTITVVPTYAFSTGSTNGRLIIFMDYYGTTKMFTIELKGQANVEILETITANASDTKLTLDLSSRIKSTDRPVYGISYDYADCVDRTGQNDNFVYADKIGTTNTESWISRGESSAYDSINKTETLTLTPNTSNKWRAAMIVVYPSKDSQVELAHIKVIQKPGEKNLADPNKSGIEVPANCYIISEPGRYILPTFEGNDVAGNTKDFSSVDDPITDGNTNVISSFDKIKSIKCLASLKFIFFVFLLC